MRSFKWPLQRNTIGLQERLSQIKFWATTDRFTNGPEVRAFEKEWSDWQGCEYSLYVGNGSVANFLLLDAVKEKFFPKHEKLTIFAPAINWATNISTFFQQRHNVYFYDIDYTSYSPTIESVTELAEKGIKPDIIYLTHVLGISNDMQRVKDLWPGVMIIEDCCESHGAVDPRSGAKVGTTGIGSTFSFYFGHHMNTVEGGMISVNDRDLYNLMRAKRSHGLSREMLPHQRNLVEHEYSDIDPSFLFPTKGYNFRNTESGAVLGRVQLKKLDTWNKKRSENYYAFCMQMAPQHWIEHVATPEGNSAMTLPFHCCTERQASHLKKELKKRGIETRPFLVGNLLLQPFMSGYTSPIKLPNTERMHTHSFYIGNNQFVTPADIRALAQELKCVF